MTRVTFCILILFVTQLCIADLFSDSPSESPDIGGSIFDETGGTEAQSSFFDDSERETNEHIDRLDLIEKKRLERQLREVKKTRKEALATIDSSCDCFISGNGKICLDLAFYCGGRTSSDEYTTCKRKEREHVKWKEEMEKICNNAQSTREETALKLNLVKGKIKNEQAYISALEEARKDEALLESKLKRQENQFKKIKQAEKEREALIARNLKRLKSCQVSWSKKLNPCHCSRLKKAPAWVKSAKVCMK